jgi:hypothetical protein
VRVPSPPTGFAVRVTDCPLSILIEAGVIETEESGVEVGGVGVETVTW